MMAGLLAERKARRFAGPLVLLLLVGCGSGEYPSELTYTPRTDPIVVEKPSEEPFYPSPPGQLDTLIGRIKSKEKGGVGGEALDPQTLKAEYRQQLNENLAKMFGTPAQPRVVGIQDDDEVKTATEKALNEWPNKERSTVDQTLAVGSVLYRRHCLTCHGLTGDGRGPTGPWISPHPRDYRRGAFKFISTDKSASRKPRREDLFRTLHHGLDGTSMPAFSVLGENDLHHLVSYVIHLSLRGQVEAETIQSILKNGNTLEGLEQESVPELTQYLLANYAKEWAGATKSSAPPPYPYGDKVPEASLRRGYKLFTDTSSAASCIGCHLDYGRQVPFRYDEWGTLVRPANLTTGVYRGGRRPLDLYWRIKIGIPPSGMPAAELKPDEYWDLINFVQALPYPKMLPPDIRTKIYEEKKQTAEHEQAAISR